MTWFQSAWFGSAHFNSTWWGVLASVPEPEIVPAGSGYRFYFPPSNRARILRDDDDIVALLLAMLQSGAIH